MNYLVFISLVMLVSLVHVHGQDCNFAACTDVFTPLQQKPGSFSVRKFEQGCSLFPTALSCMESKLARCTTTQVARFTWEIVKDVMQLTCIERRADYLDVAVCMDATEIVAASEKCSTEMQRDISRGGVCSVLERHLGCISNAFRSCGEKAIDIMYTANYNIVMSLLKYQGINKCSLVTPSAAAAQRRTRRPSATPRRTTRAPATNTGATTWPHIAAFCCFISVLLNLYR